MPALLHPAPPIVSNRPIVVDHPLKGPPIYIGGLYLSVCCFALFRSHDVRAKYQFYRFVMYVEISEKYEGCSICLRYMVYKE